MQLIQYELQPFGFWKQIDPIPYTYDQSYKDTKSHTKEDLSLLRIGWLSSYFSYDTMKSMKIVDIGCGSGAFVNTASRFFGSVSKYDVAGDSITKACLYDTRWDLIVLSDVLEHFTDINELFSLKWNYAFISFPETPKVSEWAELQSWRHFKPNEHIWCLNTAGMVEWLQTKKCEVVDTSHFEDGIRTRWNPEIPNIGSILVKSLN